MPVHAPAPGRDELGLGRRRIMIIKFGIKLDEPLLVLSRFKIERSPINVLGVSTKLHLQGK